MPEALDHLEVQLQKAVVGRRYPEVQRLVAACCEASAAQWKNLPPAAARSAFTHLTELLDWTHIMLSTSRAITAAELSRTFSISRYLECQAADASPR
jgi:hypothetical protein